MSEPSSFPRGKTTLALSTLLHAFTHAYATMLVPLYLLMMQDLNLKGDELIGIKLQGPLAMTLGWLRTSQSNKLSFSRAIEFSGHWWVLSLFTLQSRG